MPKPLAYFWLSCLLCCISLHSFAQQGTNIDFEKPFGEDYPFLNTSTYGDGQQAYMVIVRSNDDFGVLGQFFKLQDSSWLLVDHREATPKGGIYRSVELHDHDSEKPSQWSLEKVRDWPLAQDKAQQADPVIYPKVPQDSLTRYYVDGKLAAVVHYRQQEPGDPSFRDCFIHADDHFLLPRTSFIRQAEGFYSFALSEWLFMQSRGAYVYSPIVGQPNRQALLPHGFFDGRHVLDNAWAKQAPDYYITKGFFDTGKRSGWTLLHTGETEKTWLGYFDQHQIVASFEGEFDTFTDEAGKKYTPYLGVQVKDEVAQPAEPEAHFFTYFQNEWVLGQQTIPSDFDTSEETWALWTANSPLHPHIKDRALSRLHLQPDGKLLYSEKIDAEPKERGSWKLFSFLPAEGLTPYSTPNPYLVLKLVWKDGSSQSYKINRFFKDLVFLEEEG